MKKNWKYSLLLIATVFALTMGIFFLFYRFDNKYTARGDQATTTAVMFPLASTVEWTWATKINLLLEVVPIG